MKKIAAIIIVAMLSTVTLSAQPSGSVVVHIGRSSVVMSIDEAEALYVALSYEAGSAAAAPEVKVLRDAFAAALGVVPVRIRTTEEIEAERLAACRAAMSVNVTLREGASAAQGCRRGGE